MCAACVLTTESATPIITNNADVNHLRVRYIYIYMYVYIRHRATQGTHGGDNGYLLKPATPSTI